MPPQVRGDPVRYLVQSRNVAEALQALEQDQQGQSLRVAVGLAADEGQVLVARFVEDLDFLRAQRRFEAGVGRAVDQSHTSWGIFEEKERFYDKNA